MQAQRADGPQSRLPRLVTRRYGLYQGAASQAAEKVGFRLDLKGHGFSRAVQVLYFCHSERASAREESAFLTFSAAYPVVLTIRSIQIFRAATGMSMYMSECSEFRVALVFGSSFLRASVVGFAFVFVPHPHHACNYHVSLCFAHDWVIVKCGIGELVPPLFFPHTRGVCSAPAAGGGARLQALGHYPA
jgi:hypothetical protein